MKTSPSKRKKICAPSFLFLNPQSILLSTTSRDTRDTKKKILKTEEISNFQQEKTTKQNPPVF